MDRMGKGQDTRRTILRRAVDLSSELGLEGLTFGVLAKRAGMSKSGLYAHFESKESLQCDVLDAAAARFVEVVVMPALKEPRGLPRIEKLFELWMRWEADELSGGCIFIGAATEFDDREGMVRERLVGYLRDMLGTLARAARIAKEEGHFRHDLDDRQFAFECWSVLVAYQTHTRLLRDPASMTHTETAYRSLIERSRARPRDDTAPRRLNGRAR